MNEIQVTLVGNIGGGDPELRFTPSGVAVCKFRMAQTPRKMKDGKWEDGEPTWVSVTVWRDLGEHVAETLRNGMRVIVLGNLSVRSYEDKDGNKRTSTEVDVIAIGPELTFATARVDKAAKSGGTGGGQQRATAADDPWAGATPAPAASRNAQGQPQAAAAPW